MTRFVSDQSSAEPGQVLNPKKIKGYSVTVSYLVGADTVSKELSHIIILRLIRIKQSNDCVIEISG